VRSLAYQRLSVLSDDFNVHRTLESRREDHEQALLAKDFFSVAKVDNHIHLAAGMPVLDFRKFIEEKFRTEAATEVLPG